MSSYYLPKSYTFFPDDNDRFSTHPIPPTVDAPLPIPLNNNVYNIEHEMSNDTIRVRFALTNAQHFHAASDMICTDGYMLPSDSMLSLPIARLSHDIFITLTLHGLNPHSNAWLLLNYGHFKAYTPIYFNNDPTDRITNILEASTIFDDLVTQPSIYGFGNEDDLEQVCRGITPCEEDIDMIDP